jgi:hypothetical protein
MKTALFIITPLLLASCQSPSAPHETEQSRYREDVANAERAHEEQHVMEATLGIRIASWQPRVFISRA